MKNLQSAWEKSFTHSPYRIGIHVLFWMVYFGLLMWFNYYMLSMIGQKSADAWNNILFGFLCNIPLFTISYYLTMGTTYRLLMEKKKYFLAVLCLVGCFVVFTQLFYLACWGCFKLADALDIKLDLRGLTFQKIVDEKGYRGLFSSGMAWVQMLTSYFFLMSFPVAARVFRDQLRLQKKKNMLEQENLKLEMDFLKAQIHPHFLFNTLNNIYSLITHNESKKSAGMVSGLSSLLRYALYDGKTEFILLEKEIQMLKDFIALEEVRSDDTDISMAFPETIPTIKIPSFLLLPLVENAFKHGVNALLQKSLVKINVQIDTNELCLRVTNTFDKVGEKKNSGGLGLLNLRKRLDYYYKDRYYLDLETIDNLFSAVLKLPLSCPQLNASL